MHILENKKAISNRVLCRPPSSGRGPDSPRKRHRIVDFPLPFAYAMHILENKKTISK